MLSEELERSARDAVLCWLATSSADGVPNVSPKEIFAPFENNSIVIANIASPRSARNIQAAPTACVSFIDIFTQKGFQITGSAAVLRSGDPDFDAAETPLLAMTEGKFPFRQVFRVMAERIRPIVAPRYRFFADTTEAGQVSDAMLRYGVQPIDG